VGQRQAIELVHPGFLAGRGNSVRHQRRHRHRSTHRHPRRGPSEEWLWASQQSSTRAICCGILGGNHFAFLHYYADLVIRMLQHPRNRRVWQQVGANSGDNVLFEQYLLAACMDYHRASKGSPYEAVEARYLFNSMADAFDEEAAVKTQYTHLIGGAKSNPSLARSL